MRRWITRTLVILLVLTLAAVVTAEVILRTDLPRKWTTRTLSRQLGVKVTAGSLETSLWRNTTVRDFSLTVPLEDSNCLSISEIQISHSALPLLLLGRPLTLDCVKIINPSVNIRQYENGRWNIQEFASCLRQLTSGRDKPVKTALPELNIENGVSVVANRSGRIEKIGPLNCRGTPRDSGRWDFEVTVSQNVAISGKLAAGADWAHEIEFDIKDLHEIVGGLIPGLSETLSINGTLHGQAQKGELTGGLQLDSLQYGKTKTQGAIGIKVSDTGLLMRFENLLVDGLELPVEAFKIAGGSVRLGGDALEVNGVGIEARDVSGNLTGCWNWTKSDGRVSGSWAGKNAQQGIYLEGTWDGSVSWPRMGRREVDVSISARGDCPWGDWRGTAKVLGSGSTWSKSQWQVSVPRLACRSKLSTIAFEDVRAELAAEWPRVQLVSLHAANPGELNAEGEFLADKGSWAISIEAEKWKAGDWRDSSIDLRLVASGNRQDITVDQFRVNHENAMLEVSGKAALPSTELRDAHASISWAANPTPADEERFGGISGRLQCEADITGTVRPISVRLMSVLSGKNIALNRKVISAVTVPWHAQIDAERVKYESDQFELFDGLWNMSGEYEFHQPSKQLILSASEVPLPPMVELLGLPLRSRGLMAVRLKAELPSPEINELTLSGSWNIRDMVLGTLEAERADGDVRIENGVATFDRIRLEKHQGLISGGARFDLRQPQYVSVEMETQQWPWDLSGQDMTFITSGKGGAILDLLKRTVKGKGNLIAVIAANDKTLGKASAEIVLKERTIYMNDMKIEALGGSVEAVANCNLDDWLTSTVSAKWHGLDIGALEHWRPELKGFTGTSSGLLTIMPAEGRHPLEPLKIDLSADVSDGRYRHVGFGDILMSACLGRQRLVIEKSEIEIMDGYLKARGSLQRQSKGLLTYFLADFSQLELNQFAQFFREAENRVQGRLAGKGVLVIFSDFRRMTGELDAKLSESDLANTVIVRSLYDAVNAKLGQTKPTGEGQVKLRFEGSTVSIPSFTYFNRGLEIRGTGAVDDITQGRKSPVRGYAIGSVRPLKGTRLPGTEDLDRLMAALQSGVSSVEVKGTLGQPEATPVPFGQISKLLRVLLWRQLGE